MFLYNIVYIIGSFIVIKLYQSKQALYCLLCSYEILMPKGAARDSEKRGDVVEAEDVIFMFT